MSADELKMAAYAARQEGRRDEALDLYDQAVNAFDAEGEPMRSAHALRHVADLQRELGNLDAARESIGTVVDLYEREPVAPLERANALRIAALVAEAEGRVEEAREYWQHAAEFYGEAGEPEGVIEAQRHAAAFR